MQDETMNFEAINAHVDQHFQNLPSVKALNSNDAAIQLCGIYKVVRPILVGVAKVVPGNWKKALRTLIEVLDVMCPQS